jgi:hypothetical protein
MVRPDSEEALIIQKQIYATVVCHEATQAENCNRAQSATPSSGGN